MTDTRTTLSVARERAILAAVLPQGADESRLEELRSLAETAGAVVVATMIQHRQKPEPATYIGKGKVDELSALMIEHDAQVAIFENDLSPSQIGNIEEVVKRKVIDRSELILDIFAGRAKTYEAKLQVELAQLQYTYPRLTALWSHLERIVGGGKSGIGTRGPGEMQLEIDRRLVQDRKSELRKELEIVQNRKRREVAKRNLDHFTVGIVGYTNAGKSTLFNTLTGADVYADDKLFATLDTRTRRWEMGGGDAVMLSDTVGFVRNLPHHLVASFRATLEESIHSDLLLIVLDVADPEAQQQYGTVLEVLKQIGAEAAPRLLLLNKVDKLEDNAELLVWQKEHPTAIAVSAKQGLGLDKVVEFARKLQRGTELDMTLRLPMSEGKAMNFLENRAKIHGRDYDENFATLRFTIGSRQFDQLKATGAKFEVVQD
jgi:GTP-binding protein HflX